MTEAMISSEKLKVVVSSAGAEVIGLFLRESSHNWVWPAHNPWQRSAPVLFPIVGKLKDNSFIHDEMSFSLSQHGFARDLDFKVEMISESRVDFRLVADSATYDKYPFDFSLLISYELIESRLIVRYRVRNLDNEVMYFNLGWHPGFVLPGHDKSKLKISSPKKFGRHHLLKMGILNAELSVNNYDAAEIAIDGASFSQDAWVFIKSHQSEVHLSNEYGNKVIVRSDAPHWGIWSSEPLKFVCIEPWWGVADFKDASGILCEKWGIQSLAPEKEWDSVVEVELSTKSS